MLLVKDTTTLNPLPQLYAMKVIKKQRLGRNTDMAFIELEAMKKLTHPHIVRLHNVIDDPEAAKLYLVMSYVRGGTLLE